MAATQRDLLPPPEFSRHFTLEQLAWFDAFGVTDGQRYAAPDGRMVVIGTPPQGSAELPTFYYRQGD